MNKNKFDGGLTKENYVILNDTYNFAILQVISDGRGDLNISNICEKINLTYRVLLERLKILEDAGIISYKILGRQKTPSITKAFLPIFEALKTKKNLSTISLTEFLEDSKNLDFYIEFLNVISENRLITREKLFSHFYSKYKEEDLEGFLKILIDSDLVRDRLELTKHGRSLFELSKKKRNNQKLNL